VNLVTNQISRNNIGEEYINHMQKKSLVLVNLLDYKTQNIATHYILVKKINNKVY